MTRRVIAYVDGFNLYFGLRSQKLRPWYWLDLWVMVDRLLERRETLVALKYFTSRVSGPPEKVQRQNEYIEAIQARPGTSVHFGHYQSHAKKCRNCGAEHVQPSEKQTDVNIAVEILVDCRRDLLDTAVLVSADGDLVPAISAVRQLHPNVEVVVMFPPGRGSETLREAANAQRRIRSGVVKRSQLPDEVRGLDGYPKRRPREWMLPSD